jgi:hypothetical protein
MVPPSDFEFAEHLRFGVAVQNQPLLCSKTDATIRKQEKLYKNMCFTGS